MADAIKPMMPLGQFRDTFIIAVDADGIAIIDQHVAHERVLFERVMERLSYGTPRESAPARAAAGRALAGGQAGAAEPLGTISIGWALASTTSAARRFALTAVPALSEPARMRSTAMRALAEDLEGLDRGREVGDALRQIAATTACHAAVKANYPLTHEKMLHILEELAADRVFDGVSARPAGHAAPDAARNREELPAHMSPRVGAVL